MSVVKGYKLSRHGTLDFNFRHGGCTVLNQTTIVLCFDSWEKDLCRQSNNPLGPFTDLPSSNYEHSFARVASLDGKKTIKGPKHDLTKPFWGS